MTAPEVALWLRTWLDVHEPKLSILRAYAFLVVIAILDGGEVIKPSIREAKRLEKL